MKIFRVAPLAITFGFAMSVASAQTTLIGGVKFEDLTAISGVPVQLNGAGVRYKFFVKLYAIGLYAGTKLVTPEAAFTYKGARRIHLVMLRTTDSDELGRVFIRRFEENVTKDEFSKVINGTIRLGEMFSTRKSMGLGESISIDSIPGRGVVVSINGKPISDPILDPGFFNILLKIWLGDKPVDTEVKEAMLGRSPAAIRERN